MGGKEKVKKTKTSPFLLFLSIGVLNPFQKKSKADSDSDVDVEDVWVGDKSNGIGPMNGSSGIDTKKVEEMEGGLNDLKDKIKTIETGNKSIKSELEGLRGDLKKTNETIKQLLSVYEVVSQQYNPFVEQVPKKPQEVVTSPQANPSSNAASETWPKETKPVPTKVVAPSPYDRVIGSDTDALNALEKIVVENRPKEVVGAIRGGEKMAMTGGDKDAALRADRNLQDNYYIMQILKLIEFQLEKIYLAKVNRAPVDTEDLQNLDRWLAEFKRVGLR